VLQGSPQGRLEEVRNESREQGMIAQHKRRCPKCNAILAIVTNEWRVIHCCNYCGFLERMDTNLKLTGGIKSTLASNNPFKEVYGDDMRKIPFSNIGEIVDITKVVWKS
jgi:ribosomal protein S27AE